jgi:Mrp family chromosome partitioning ATPase
MKLSELNNSLIRLYDEITMQQNKAVCFTASSPQEGTTTIASGMAKAVASLGLKVLYCDFCDYDTSLSKQLNQNFVKSKGDALAQFNNNTYFIESLGFHLIPPPVNHLTLLDNEVVTQLLEQAKEAYNLIVIDTNYFNNHSAVGKATDKLYKITDSTVLVVLSGGVTEEAVKGVVDKMHHKGIKISGIVMNDVNNPKLIDELTQASHKLDEYCPKIANKLRVWLDKSSLLKIEI